VPVVAADKVASAPVAADVSEEASCGGSAGGNGSGCGSSSALASSDGLAAADGGTGCAGGGACFVSLRQEVRPRAKSAISERKKRDDERPGVAFITGQLGKELLMRRPLHRVVEIVFRKTVSAD
jgi:hypothetical protein